MKKKIISILLSLLITVSVIPFSAVSGEGAYVDPGIEELFGSSTELDDTDGDGLSDGVEIYQTGTLPTETDSDGNGIPDPNEDADNDGLSNIEELDIGTDVGRSDTDRDGLSDYNEVVLYHTDPIEDDTDGDGLTDGDELMFGLDPNDPVTDGVTPDGERVFTQTVGAGDALPENSAAIPRLTADVSGNIEDKIDISKSCDPAFSDSRSIVGEPVDIKGDGLDSGVLSFSLAEGTDVSAQNGPVYEGVCLKTICRYAEDGSTEILDTEFDPLTNTLKADVTAEGTYFVLDVGALINELSGSDGSEAAAQADIVFIIDSTCSMVDEIESVRESVSSFVDSLNEKGISAAIALVEYKDATVDGYDSTIVHTSGGSNWFYDTEEFKACLSDMLVYGGGDMPETAVDALETARLLDMRASAGKVFILVTDDSSKPDNRYGISSLDDEIVLLNNSCVKCSVIGDPRFADHYSGLYGSTGGVFMDVYSDLNASLMSIADNVGSGMVGDGYRIYLDGAVPIPVRLDAKPEYGSLVDTDKDGIPDIKELESVEPNGSIDLDELIARVSRGAITGTSYGTVMTYRYKSNPAAPDTDYDGTYDFEDNMPKSNVNTGLIHFYDDGYKTCPVGFTMDYRYLIDTDSSVYSKDISMLSIILASDMYQNVYTEITGGAQTGGSDDPRTIGRMIGLSDPQIIRISADSYAVDKDDQTEVLVGHRKIIYNGIENEVIVAAVRGTNGTNAEWSSNFDVGADTAAYYSATGYSHPDWKDKINHKGFDVTANRVMQRLSAYIAQYVEPTARKNILITGHSRGAAIANIIGKCYEDDPLYNSYTYTYATPNNTTAANRSSYKTIFNIINEDDMIPYLPLDSWGFGNYGSTRSISVRDYYGGNSSVHGSWEWLTGYDYVSDSGTQRTLNAFAKIASAREELYVLDSTSDGTVWENNVGHTTKAGAETELAELSASLTEEKMLRFCKLSIVKTAFIYHVEVNYCPAYFMQTLANMTTSVGPLLGRDVKGKYATAKASFVASSGVIPGGLIGGMTHPHFAPTYYLIVYNNVEALK